MSSYLSEALGAEQARLTQAIKALERRSQHPNHDVRLSSSITQQVRLKIKELGLDPDDTNAAELYETLKIKLQKQDVFLNKKVRYLAAKSVSAEANVNDGLAELIKYLKIKKTCFALKPSVVKRELKANPPKKAMKALNYRSLESMLKLEPIPLIMLAINNFESESYISHFYNRYRYLKASDFEARDFKIYVVKNRKWQKILEDIRDRSGLTLVSSWELASIILLPVDNQTKTGYLTVSLVNLLSEIELILSVSSYLKVNQVNMDFGSKLKDITSHEPYIDMKILDKPIAWRTAQAVLAKSNFSAEHISLEDILPNKTITKLADLFKEFKFWEDTEALALIKSGEVASLNILDIAIDLVNDVSFNKRSLDHFRYELNQELAKLYLKPQEVVDSVNTSSNNLASEYVNIEDIG